MTTLITSLLVVLFSFPIFSSAPTYVEYRLEENGGYYAIVTDGNQVTKVRLCSADELDRFEIGAEIYRGKNSSRIYNLIIKPLEKHIGKTVYFKPAGKIHFINIAALADDKGKRCCQKYHIRRVSSMTNATSSGKVDFNSIKMYLFGGMVYDADPERMFQNCWWVYRDNYWGAADGNNQLYSSAGPERMWRTSEQLNEYVQDAPGWDMNSVVLGTADDGTRAGYDQLQYSRGEIKFIYSLRGFNIQKYTGDTALEENFKLKSMWGDPCIIHLSTHSLTLDASQSPFFQFYNPKDIAYKTTGLLFTGARHTLEGNKLPYGMNDGLLYAEEIARYDFSKVDLLVLSACGTALGTVTNDGVIGLQSAFKDAGAKTIVSTLWSINDRAAAEFMKSFYSFMFDGYSKYEAFEMAREAMMESKDFGDPLYWAPFIMLD